ncbi:MAG: SpoIID/LytB domain-containing protein [Actinobacteria bacterium]|nr:SpoIID/LytB domain-containing protein [Actinomycetota bacterium]
MGAKGRRAGSLMITLALAGLSISAAPEAAAAKGKKRPPAPQPGFVVDRARFESLDGSPLGVGQQGPYRGAMEVVRPRGGGISVVNHVAFEDYLKGISEMPTSWPLEAQKAQAIAARTYVLSDMARKVATAYRAAGADICATDACQVYTGLEKERRPGSEAWSRAVEATRGQVLYHKGAPILAKYSSSNGGRTVAGGKPYLRAVDDPDDRQSPLHRWRVGYPLAEVGRVLGLPAPPVDVHRAGDEVVVSRLDGDGNRFEQRLPADDFRARLNAGLPAPEGLPLAVPSNRFGAGTVDGAVVVEGRGWGHGIGLSQFGALGKARRGLKAPDILAAYYGGLRPVTLPAEKVPELVRVAVVIDAGSTVVTGEGGSFRVTDGSGAVVAHAASGKWGVFPGPRGKGLRLVPPSDQAGPATAEVAATEPTAPVSGQPLVVHLRLTGPPAVTRVHLSAPDGATTEVDPPTLRPAGDLVVRLAPSAAVGLYTVAVEREAGAGRATSSTLVVGVGVPEAPPPGVTTVSSGATVDGAAAAPVPPGVVKTAAASLLLGVISLSATVSRRRRIAAAFDSD